MEQLLHLALGLVQLLQHPLDVSDGTAVWRLVGGDGGVSAKMIKRLLEQLFLLVFV